MAPPSSPTQPHSPIFTPSLPPPPGHVPNPEHPATLTRLANITIGIGLPLVTIFFLLRTYARLFIKHQRSFEDVLVTVSWAGTVAYCAIMRATMSHHAGQHGWDITKEQAHAAAYWFNVTSIEYGAIIPITKLAVLSLYRRVFSTRRWSGFDIACVVLMVIVPSYYLSNAIVKIWECSPRDKIWNPAVPGRCLNLTWILNFSGAFNMLSDLLILLLPSHAVWHLQVDRKKRLLIFLAFTFGLCAPIFATVGFVVRLKKSGDPDTTWNQPEILLWAAAELVSGNLCVCFPELAVIFRKKTRARITAARAPKRPWTSSSFIKSWRRESRKRQQPSYPHFTKSLMGTSNTNEGPFIELHEPVASKSTTTATS